MLSIQGIYRIVDDQINCATAQLESIDEEPEEFCAGNVQRLV
jgi:hypothetical protein